MYIAALSQTSLAEEGHLRQQSVEYIFFWIGRVYNERRQTEVGFAIKSIMINMLAARPKEINERLMTPAPQVDAHHTDQR